MRLESSSRRDQHVLRDLSTLTDALHNSLNEQHSTLASCFEIQALMAPGRCAKPYFQRCRAYACRPDHNQHHQSSSVRGHLGIDGYCLFGHVRFEQYFCLEACPNCLVTLFCATLPFGEQFLILCMTRWKAAPTMANAPVFQFPAAAQHDRDEVLTKRTGNHYLDVGGLRSLGGVGR